MGLTISYNLIKQHKGDIKEQNLKEGVEFTIELPLKQ
jgi:signal transduction histidine kinase